MSNQTSMPYQFPPVGLLPPAADATGRTSAYVSLKRGVKSWIIARVNQGNAAQVTFAPLQATNVAGLGSKPINAVPIWLVADTATGDALVAQTAAAGFATSATLKDKIVVFEITPDAALDVNNGYDCVALQTGASNAANITAATIHILGSYQQTTPPSALTN